MELRPYQIEAVHAVYEHLRTRDDNPCVVLPTAAGKSLCIAQICSDAVLRWGGRVLILAHVKELLQQNADKLHRLAPDVDFGVYSAGLKSRCTKEPVIMAGIQSVHKRACALGRFDLILIDEAHLLPESGEGMYQTFMKEAKIVNPHVRLIGFTATPYRLSSGMLCKPENLLNHVCYEKGIKELIHEGFLCRIHTKVPAQKIDCSNIHVRNGEFRSEEVAELFSTENAVHSIFTDIFKNTQDRNKILIFCADVAQATLFQREIQRVAEAGLITGETPANERAELIARFQDKPTGLLHQVSPLRWLVNVNVLTTGFDAPAIDCVVLARPTLSPGLYYQMTGRGFRLHESKTDTLVLDYGGNIQRHGCVDAIRIKTKNGGDGNGEAPIRECPECHHVLPISISRCAECGYVFPMREPESKLDATASKDGILSGQITEKEFSVSNVAYSKHYKKNGSPDGPPTLRIDYEVGINEFVSKWVCPEHKGWAWSNKFVPWWKQRTHLTPPTTVDDALNFSPYLAIPQRLTVIETAGQRFAEIIEHDFTEKPEMSPDYTPPKTCGDCGLFFKGDCPYRVSMFGCETVCEHFLDAEHALETEEVPF
ncbi:MAG: DEAD/DEAH box helicase [Planctomycetaceae bacterium]|jgi:DNA repair protein RadD|nr:DEAD/DEAH box helicase [Planctomycetaceae bacterium]